MVYLFLAPFALFFLFLIFLSIKKWFITSQYNPKKELPAFDEPTDDTWNWSHNTASFKLMGLNYYDVTEGHKEAYIVAERHNPYDENAILVVTRDGNPLGHLPRGNSYLYHQLVSKYNRYLPVNVVIHSNGDDGQNFYYGYADICLDTYPDFDKKKFVTGYYN